MGPEFFAIAGPIGWLAAWIIGSIVYRRTSGKPLFPRAPDGAVFAEAWRSGRSLQNALTRVGGARNCLLVYVADGELTIVPVFPFNLMFLPEIYGLEITTSISNVWVNPVDDLLGKRLLLTVEGPKEKRFELRLHNEQGFRDALEGTGTAPSPLRDEDDKPVPLSRPMAIIIQLAALLLQRRTKVAGMRASELTLS